MIKVKKNLPDLEEGLLRAGLQKTEQPQNQQQKQQKKYVILYNITLPLFS